MQRSSASTYRPRIPLPITLNSSHQPNISQNTRRRRPPALPAHPRSRRYGDPRNSHPEGHDRRRRHPLLEPELRDLGRRRHGVEAGALARAPAGQCARRKDPGGVLEPVSPRLQDGLHDQH